LIVLTFKESMTSYSLLSHELSIFINTVDLSQEAGNDRIIGKVLDRRKELWLPDISRTATTYFDAQSLSARIAIHMETEKLAFAGSTLKGGATRSIGGCSINMQVKGGFDAFKLSSVCILCPMPSFKIELTSHTTWEPRTR